MMRPVARRGLALLLVAATAALGAGCDTIYYRTMKKFGQEKRDILVKRVKDARSSQADAQKEFKSALERFQAIVEVEGGSLTSIAGFDGHQGVALVVEARRFASVEDILARAIERSEAPFVLVLDSLEDPQNVGTLLRSAEAAGVHGVLFPTERQAPLSPAAVKASAGATEHLLLAPVDDLAGALTDLHLRGLRVVGSEMDAALTLRQADLRGPIAVVVGSEGHGLAPAVRRRCDLFVKIPMRGLIGSLNAAVAGSILVFEVAGQREPPAP